MDYWVKMWNKPMIEYKMALLLLVHERPQDPSSSRGSVHAPWHYVGARHLKN